MKNSKILIPETPKQKFLMQIHHGHQGIKACRKKAREFVFWVNINKDIEELVQKCSICQSLDKVTSIIRKYVSEVRPHPWHTLGSDLFYFRRIDFLVVVDYFSKYLLMKKLSSKTPSASGGSRIFLRGVCQFPNWDYFANFLPKLHENERIWTPGGMHPWHPP